MRHTISTADSLVSHRGLLQASDFMQNYNKLHRQTMVNNTTDSTHMHEAIQPIVVQQVSSHAQAEACAYVSVSGLPQGRLVARAETHRSVPRHVLQRARIAGAFKEFDINGDGVIDLTEFATGVRNLAKLDDDRIQELCGELRALLDV